MDEKQLKELDPIEKLDAEGCRVFDPIEKNFDHGAKRCTDLPENSRVGLPGLCYSIPESGIEMLITNILKTFNKYQKRVCNEKGEQKSNISRTEQRGLRELRKRIKNHEILILKTDKSGKLTVITRDEYLKMGLEKCSNDERTDREEHKRIER